MTKEDFAEWVASEIFSDNWEVNKNSFEEIACRKLVKLGIVEQIDGHYQLNNERENKKMTKEKAIKAIKEKYRDPEYIDEIIKALEQEPCDDYISRADAIKALEYSLSIEADGGLDGYRTVIKDLLDAIYDMQKKAIKDLPSMQPKTEVLDKIRDEIDELDTLRFSSGERIYKDEVLDIIDKYRK